MTEIQMKRSGNLLEIDGFDHRFDKFLDTQLTYRHKKFYRGAELAERKRLIRAGQLRGNPAFSADPVSLYTKTEAGAVVTGAGMRSRLCAALSSLNISYEYEDLRPTNKLLEPARYDRLTNMDDLEFRKGQAEALASIEACDGGVIVAPTGFGKTFLMVLLTQIYPDSVIHMVAPGISLLESIFSRLIKVAPSKVGRIYGSHNDYEKRIILCSADSLHKLPYSKAHLLLYDEVHTAATERRSRLLCNHYTDAKFIGLTGSHNSRMDGADAVVESIFGPKIAELTYSEAQEAGSVAKINTQFFKIEKSINSPENIEERRSDLKKKYGYWVNMDRNRKIADAAEICPTIIGKKDPQILIICETVEHIFELRRFLPDYEVVYTSVSDKLQNSLERRGLWRNEFTLNKELMKTLIAEGKWDIEDFSKNKNILKELRESGEWEQGDYMTPSKRSYLLKEFEEGRLKRVIANYCWKQGIDPVYLDVLIRADGGTSAINNIQLPGRLSRVNENKTEGMLIDFVDEWSSWAYDRSKARLRVYKQNGFNILKPKTI